MSEKLLAFIRHARDKGLEHGIIRTLLLASGWKERDIAGAVASESLDLPVPEPGSARNARDAFLYLASGSATAGLTLWVPLAVPVPTVGSRKAETTGPEKTTGARPELEENTGRASGTRFDSASADGCVPLARPVLTADSRKTETTGPVCSRWLAEADRLPSSADRSSALLQVPGRQLVRAGHDFAAQARCLRLGITRRETIRTEAGAFVSLLD